MDSTASSTDILIFHLKNFIVCPFVAYFSNIVVLLSSPGLSGQTLESTPSSPVLKQPGETLSLSCKGAGFTFSSYNMHWIRQPTGKALDWVGYIWNDATRTFNAKSVEGRVEITRDNSNSMVYLKLSGLRAEDSAVYYCARDSQ